MLSDAVPPSFFADLILGPRRTLGASGDSFFKPGRNSPWGDLRSLNAQIRLSSGLPSAHDIEKFQFPIAVADCPLGQHDPQYHSRPPAATANKGSRQVTVAC